MDDEPSISLYIDQDKVWSQNKIRVSIIIAIINHFLLMGLLNIFLDLALQNT